MTGYFITFEGVEGSGKSTQIKRAAAYLKKRHWDVLVLREPGGTRVGEAIRDILLDKTHTVMMPQTELLLYLAARAQLVKEKIEPALTKGQVVILDRYEDSTTAYQGFGRGFPLHAIEWVSRNVVRGDLKPDLTFLFDLDPAEGLRRRKRDYDRIERESLSFHRKVRQGFLAAARKDPKRFLVIDARKDRRTIFAQMKARLDRVTAAR